MYRRLFLAIALAALGACATAQQQEPAGAMRLERVVMLMRHGVRPPTRPEVTPVGVAADAWPAWDVPLGHLTAHGYDAVLRLGAYDRAHYAGLFAEQGCPRPEHVLVNADSDQRTIRTGEAMMQAMFPDCEIAVTHLREGELDGLYSPLDLPGMDLSAAEAEILRDIGSLERVRDAHGDEFDLLARVLGCCAPEACTAAGAPAPCHLRELPSGFVREADDGRPRLDGPMNFAPTAVMTLVMEYADGRPMEEVGWGRVTREEITQLTGLYVMKVETLQRPYYVGARGASPLMRRMLSALTDDAAPAFTLFVGHDTNISDLSGLLGIEFHIASYAANFPPPGGALGFELWRDQEGRGFVRAFYRAQTLDQMRELTPLSASSPPERQDIALPACAPPEQPSMCSLDRLDAWVRARLR